MTESTSSNRFSGLITGIPVSRFGSFPEAFRPFIEIGLKAQSEFLHLYNCRSRAWLDWPGQCIACNNFDDLTKAQREYVDRMQKDYAHFMDAILRDTLIEQDGYTEENSPDPAAPLHREAA